VHAVDPGVPVDEIASMDHVLDASGARRGLLARLSLIFAIAALGLASLGLYGVIAYSVSQRTREIGVRKALGASTRSVVLHVLGETWSLVAAGIGIGFVAAAALGRVVAPLLFGVTTLDWVTFVLAPVALIGVALGASVWPSVQAGRVDPAIAMRGE
jgi:putative ABC transport system permease protein